MSKIEIFEIEKIEEFSKENSMKIENFKNLKNRKIDFHWIFFGKFPDFFRDIKKNNLGVEKNLDKALK